MSDPSNGDFERLASEHADRGLLGEFWDFLRFNKKWWLLPIVVVLLLIGLLADVHRTYGFAQVGIGPWVGVAGAVGFAAAVGRDVDRARQREAQFGELCVQLG